MSHLDQVPPIAVRAVLALILWGSFRPLPLGGGWHSPTVPPSPYKPLMLQCPQQWPEAVAAAGGGAGVTHDFSVGHHGIISVLN